MVNKNEVFIENLSKFAIKNKQDVVNSTLCSCYYCLKVFDSNEVTKWIDNSETAICPYCQIDSVVPFELRMDFLEKANEYWFGIS